MPILDNPKHEHFAQALAKGKSATEAYALAGYKEDRSAASRLSANVNIASRVNELLERVAARTEMTLERISDMFEEDREFARKLEQPAAAVSATYNLAKLHGHMIERKEIGGIGDFARMKDDELMRYIADRAGAIGGLLGYSGGEPETSH